MDWTVSAPVHAPAGTDGLDAEVQFGRDYVIRADDDRFRQRLAARVSPQDITVLTPAHGYRLARARQVMRAADVHDVLDVRVTNASRQTSRAG